MTNSDTSRADMPMAETVISSKSSSSTLPGRLSTHALSIEELQSTTTASFRQMKLNIRTRTSTKSNSLSKSGVHLLGATVVVAGAAVVGAAAVVDGARVVVDGADGARVVVTGVNGVGAVAGMGCGCRSVVVEGMRGAWVTGGR